MSFKQRVLPGNPDAGKVCPTKNKLCVCRKRDVKLKKERENKADSHATARENRRGRTEHELMDVSTFVGACVCGCMRVCICLCF